MSDKDSKGELKPLEELRSEWSEMVYNLIETPNFINTSDMENSIKRIDGFMSLVESSTV